jgi:hypothetical protein
MSNEFLRAVQDRQFWNELGTAFQTAPKRFVSELQSFGRIPEEADRIAEQRFPNSARDNSAKNDFRHALGTGMLAQRLGGGFLGANLAKMAGYGWEALGAKEFIRDEKHRQDTLQDLKANAIGARFAQETDNQQELIRQLDSYVRTNRSRNSPDIQIARQF